MADGLNVISSRLLEAQVGVQRGVSGSTSQTFIIFRLDVFTSLWILITFSQTEIDYVDDALPFSCSNKEIVGLDISMDKMILVHKVDSLYHLVRYHDGRFNCEFPSTIFEQVFKTGP